VTFVLLRCAFVLALMLPIALVQRAQWPATPAQASHIAVAGVLLHGGYLAGFAIAVLGVALVVRV
jgi:hypothetical protein